jgi:hypothetical protein
MMRLRSGSGRARRLAFGVTAAMLLAWEVYAIFLAQYGTPSVKPARSRFWVGEIAGGVSVSQTFTLEAAGFNRIVIRARPYGRAASGQIVFELREMAPGGERLLYRVAKPATTVTASGTYTVRFSPIQESAHRSYRFVVTAPRARPGEGIALLANNEESYPLGALFVGDREQWGDLVFEAGASRATIFTGVEYLLRDKSPLLRSRWLLAAVFALYNWALMTFLYFMAFAGDERV